MLAHDKMSKSLFLLHAENFREETYCGSKHSLEKVSIAKIGEKLHTYFTKI